MHRLGSGVGVRFGSCEIALKAKKAFFCQKLEGCSLGLESASCLYGWQSRGVF